MGDPDEDGAFFDAWAPLYDAEVAGAEPDDVAFYRDLAVEADGPVLEVGCGTGRVYLELLRAGVDADGIDLSAGMLDRLRDRAAEAGLEPSVRQADARTFAPDREYALVIVPFRAFNHLSSLDDRRAGLASVREALAPGGRLALNTFVPSFDVICETYGEPRERTVTHGGERYRLVTESTLADELAQVARLRKAAYRLDGADDGDLVFERTTRLALISRQEFELLFEVAGFSDWRAYGGFAGDPLEDGDREQVWIAER